MKPTSGLSKYPFLGSKMNLYKLHKDPTSLLHNDKAHEILPDLFWKKYEKQPAEMKKREPAIAKDAYYSYIYARDVLKRRFPAGEPTIAKDSGFAYTYALFVVGGPWPEGEEAIAKDQGYSNMYASKVLKHDFYFHGKLIAKAH